MSDRQPNGIVDKTTGTIHRRETDNSGLTSVCGVTYNLAPGTLSPVLISKQVDRHHTAKCDRCFGDRRGY